MKMPTLLAIALLPFFAAAQTLDSAAIWQVDSLIKISRVLTGKGNFDQALEVSAAAEKIALEKLGRETAAYGSCCISHGRVLYDKGEYSEAEKWYLESKVIREKVLGKEHPDYSAILSHLGNLYFSIADYNKAKTFHLETLSIREKILGKANIEYVGTVINLANVYWRTNDIKKAESFYLEAINIFETQIKDTRHPYYRNCLSNLAGLYYELGNYEMAEELMIKTINLIKKEVGKENPMYASCTHNLATFYFKMANYEKAEQIELESKSIKEKLIGKEHPEYSASLQLLGDIYTQCGLYEKSEPLYLEAISINDKALGKEHPDNVNLKMNFANFYSSIGNYEKALQLNLEAKTIKEKTTGNDDPSYALIINNLGISYHGLGDYKKAEQCYLETLAIREKYLSKNHPEYAVGLSCLASLYSTMGQYEKAELLLLESLSILEKTLNKETPDYSYCLYYLANLYLDTKDYEKAERLYLQAKSLQEKIFGKEHTTYVNNLIKLANLYENQGNFSASELLLEEVVAIQHKWLSSGITFLSEQELAEYASSYQVINEMLGSYQLKRQSPFTTTFSKITFNHTVFQKGFLLNALASINVRSEANPETAEINNRLKSYRRRLAAEYSRPVTERKMVVELEEKAASAEKELARTIAGYAESLRQVEWREVQDSLKKNEAAIEFIHFNVNFPNKTDSIMYATVLLRSGDEQPTFIPLFEEKQLTAVLTANKKEPHSELLAQVYTRGAKPIKQGNQSGLYELIWKPLDSLLSNTTTVYFSPSGLLHRINFDAIPVPVKQGIEGEILGDRLKLVCLGSTRSLVVPDFTKTSLANDAVLFGGIQYEIDTTTFSQDSTTQDLLTLASGELSFTYADRSVPSRGENWNFLPGTEKEVAQIQSLLKKAKFSPQVLAGEKATEEAFKTLGQGKPSPRILHVATHGFFFPDPKSVDSQQLAISSQEEPVFKISDHPMIRSGLILAGGNYAWKTGKPLKPNMEDGILTAYEISQMNLSNTELVVLSACETGLGDIQGNEGVYGLQRAFKIAGAKYLVMSLWQVPDQETSVFMTTFYKHWLEGKMTIPEAFRTTQQEMRERFINPYQWAGFVLVE